MFNSCAPLVLHKHDSQRPPKKELILVHFCVLLYVMKQENGSIASLSCINDLVNENSSSLTKVSEFNRETEEKEQQFEERATQLQKKLQGIEEELHEIRGINSISALKERLKKKKNQFQT